MPFVKKDAIPDRPLVMGIYGEPGIGKSTIGFTANAPVLIDFDQGYHRAGIIKDVFSPTSWDDFSNALDSGNLDDFKTLIIDTPKSCLDDFLMPHVIKKNPKFRTNKLQAYGAIQDEFKLFVNTARRKGMDVLWVAHNKDEKDGEQVVKTPDITGGSYGFILRISDQVGYMSVISGQRSISFEPTDTHRTKDTAGLKKVAIPALNKPEFANYLAEVITTTKSAIKDRQSSIMSRTTVVDEFAERITTASTTEEINTLMADIQAVKEEGAKLLVKGLFAKRVKELGYVYDKAKGYQAPAPVVEEPVATPAPVAEALAEPEKDEVLEEIASSLPDVENAGNLNALVESYEWPTMEPAKLKARWSIILQFAEQNGYVWNKEAKAFEAPVEA